MQDSRPDPVRLLLLLFGGAFFSLASAQSNLCTNFAFLIEQSKSQFLTIRGVSGSDFDGFDATFVLPDALYCVILEDLEKSSYQCTWKFSYRNEKAQKTFHRFRSEMRRCIGDLAEEHRDQAVNHPDYYLSYYYPLPGGEASVTLKNKVKLMNTFVSIGFDGFKNRK